MRPDQLAALRCIAEAAVAAEPETGCPAEISAAQCTMESDRVKVPPGNSALAKPRMARVDVGKEIVVGSLASLCTSLRNAKREEACRNDRTWD